MKDPKEIIAKAKELEVKLNEGLAADQEKQEVMPLCFNITPEDQVIGYVRHPNYDEMAVAFEKMATGNSIDGAEIVLDRCLIKEESDSRFLDKTFKKIRFSAVTACIQFVKGYENEVKKKSDTIPVR